MLIAAVAPLVLMSMSLGYPAGWADGQGPLVIVNSQSDLACMRRMS